MFTYKPQLNETGKSNYLYADICKSQLAANSIRFKGIKLWSTLIRVFFVYEKHTTITCIAEYDYC